MATTAVSERAMGITTTAAAMWLATMLDDYDAAEAFRRDLFALGVETLADVSEAIRAVCDAVERATGRPA